MNINVINNSKHETPKYSTPQSAGMDLRANIASAITIQPLERKLIPTGLIIEIPNGYEGQIRPRSGLAIKKGITVLNAPGTIDSDYRGEVGVILINLSDSDFIVKDGARIAQMIVSKHEQPLINEVKFVTKTQRGDGGFGSTGIK